MLRLRIVNIIWIYFPNEVIHLIKVGIHYFTKRFFYILYMCTYIDHMLFCDTFLKVILPILNQKSIAKICYAISFIRFSLITVSY